MFIDNLISMIWLWKGGGAASASCAPLFLACMHEHVENTISINYTIDQRHNLFPI